MKKFEYNFEKGKEAADLAKVFLGKKEIPNNAGFEDKVFEKEMRSVGFYTGAPWCGFLPKLLWKKVKLNHKFLSASSYLQVEASKGPMKDNWHNLPVDGAVAVWAVFKKGVRQKYGHFSIVVDVYTLNDKQMFDTVDGNSNSDGSREGKEVAFRNHTLDKRIWSKKEGTRLLGFVYPTDQKGDLNKGLI